MPDWCSVPGRHLKLTVETVTGMKTGGLDYLYFHIEDHLDMTSYNNGLAFFTLR